MVLRHCFGLESYSLYSDEEFSSTQVQSLVGEKPIGPDPKLFLHRLRESGGLACIKTHELPGGDGHPAIYVLRDGRSALVSHYHYLHEVRGWDIRLEGLIAGAHFTPWSQHVRAWLLSGRPNVLPVRFENLVYGQPETLAAIAGFLRRKQLQEFSSSFSTAQNLMPEFFRFGSNRVNLAEMTGAQLAMFDELHGNVWRSVGYS